MKQFLALIILLTFIAKNSYSGGLMITPHRVELKDAKLSEEVKLVNHGDEITTYRISFQHLKMNQAGGYETIVESQTGKEKFVDDFIQYSPKRVTLNPGDVQTVRLIARVPDNLEIGEYRSHLLFKEEAPVDSGNNIENKKSNSKSISIVLKPLFAISIPVILTHGDTKVKAAIENMEFKNDPKNTNQKNNKSLFMTIARSGNASAYGYIIATFTPQNSSTSYKVATINNVSIFYPYDKRDFTLLLDMPKNVPTTGGAIEAKFYVKNGADQSDKDEVLAAKIITLR